ncbi:putative nucleic acid-binding protein [Rhizobium sp. PP-WC-1G-195]|nr:putative nucleic acid-binding protein [Rhizobium sp. PP-WC-1G-195]
MRQPPSFGKVSAPIVVDTSVIINLNATGRAEDIIRSYGMSFCASDIVREELVLDRLNGRDDAAMAEVLVQRGLLVFLPFDNESELIFESLINGDAVSTLDDGEAATLSLAVSLDRGAVIDERKAIRIAGERFPALQILATADILNCDWVSAALGSAGIADVVFKALKDARMAIPERHHDWVADLLGPRVVECRSLPAALRQVHK